MEILIIFLLAISIISLIDPSIAINFILSFGLLWILLVLNYILFQKMHGDKGSSLNPLININKQLERYDFNKFIIYLLTIFYIGITTLLVFYVGSYIVWFPISEALPFYRITEPTLNILMISSLILLPFYIFIKILLYKRMLKDLNKPIYHIIPLLLLDSLYFSIIKNSN